VFFTGKNRPCFQKKSHFVCSTIYYEKTWVGFWTCCKKHWRQKSYLQRGLMELPISGAAAKTEGEITQYDVQRKLNSHFKVLKNSRYIRNIW
jgi:hypothetical protein